jgi:hypothetical protein
MLTMIKTLKRDESRRSIHMQELISAIDCRRSHIRVEKGMMKSWQCGVPTCLQGDKCHQLNSQ